jgi:hypothetical protein
MLSYAFLRPTWPPLVQDGLLNNQRHQIDDEFGTMFPNSGIDRKTIEIEIWAVNST